jgi:signal transduction histidine kinase
VVSAFLDYARPLKQNFGPTDVNEVVTRTIRLIQNEIPPNIELKLELREGLARVEGDAEQLKQVLINLVQNALEAIGQANGQIAIRTLPPDRFGEFRGSDAVELHVADTGGGIPGDQQLNIFVPFFTTKQKGTGLGLAICQRIVKNHGGSISVQSRVSEGATFIIRLPALPTEPPWTASAETGETPSPPARSTQTPEPNPLGGDDRPAISTDELHQNRRSFEAKKKKRAATP